MVRSNYLSMQNFVNVSSKPLNLRISCVEVCGGSNFEYRTFFRFEVWHCKPRRNTVEERKGCGVAAMQAVWMNTVEERKGFGFAPMLAAHEIIHALRDLIALVPCPKNCF